MILPVHWLMIPPTNSINIMITNSSLLTDNVIKLSTSLVILCIFLSCQKKDNGLVNQGLSYPVATVIIDSKGRLLDLKRDIEISDLGNDEKEFFCLTVLTTLLI